jgi:hypothetical protein
MRTKINETTQKIISSRENNIYRVYSSEFDALTSSDIYWDNPIYINKTYVKRSDLEDKLTQALIYEGDSFIFILARIYRFRQNYSYPKLFPFI